VTLLISSASSPSTHFVECGLAAGKRNCFFARPPAADLRGWLPRQNIFANPVVRSSNSGSRSPAESCTRTLDTTLAFVERNLTTVRIRPSARERTADNAPPSCTNCQISRTSRCARMQFNAKQSVLAQPHVSGSARARPRRYSACTVAYTRCAGQRRLAWAICRSLRYPGISPTIDLVGIRARRIEPAHGRMSAPFFRLTGIA